MVQLHNACARGGVAARRAGGVRARRHAVGARAPRLGASVLVVAVVLAALAAPALAGYRDGGVLNKKKLAANLIMNRMMEQGAAAAAAAAGGGGGADGMRFAEARAGARDAPTASVKHEITWVDTLPPEWQMPGIDFFSRGVSAVDGTQPPRPVFEWTYAGESSPDASTARTLQMPGASQVFFVPDQLEARPYESCDFSSETTWYSSVVKYTSSRGAALGLSQTETSGGALTASAEAQHMAEEMADSSTEMIKSKAQCLVAAAELVSVKTTEEFRAAFKVVVELVKELRAAAAPQLAELESATAKGAENVVVSVALAPGTQLRRKTQTLTGAFFDAFGTHYIDRGALGGELDSTTFLSQESFGESSHTSYSLALSGSVPLGELAGAAAGAAAGAFTGGAASNAAASAVKAVIPSVSASYSRSHSKSKTSSRGSSEGKTTVSAIGGEPGSFAGPTEESWANWASTLPTNPVPLNQRLLGMHTLLLRHDTDPELLAAVGLSERDEVKFVARVIQMLSLQHIRARSRLREHTYTVLLQWGNDYDSSEAPAEKVPAMLDKASGVDVSPTHVSGDLAATASQLSQQLATAKVGEGANERSVLMPATKMEKACLVECAEKTKMFYSKCGYYAFVSEAQMPKCRTFTSGSTKVTAPSICKTAPNSKCMSGKAKIVSKEDVPSGVLPALSSEVFDAPLSAAEVLKRASEKTALLEVGAAMREGVGAERRHHARVHTRARAAAAVGEGEGMGEGAGSGSLLGASPKIRLKVELISDSGRSIGWLMDVVPEVGRIMTSTRRRPPLPSVSRISLTVVNGDEFLPTLKGEDVAQLGGAERVEKMKKRGVKVTKAGDVVPLRVVHVYDDSRGEMTMFDMNELPLLKRTSVAARPVSLMTLPSPSYGRAMDAFAQFAELRQRPAMTRYEFWMSTSSAFLMKSTGDVVVTLKGSEGVATVQVPVVQERYWDVIGRRDRLAHKYRHGAALFVPAVATNKAYRNFVDAELKAAGSGLHWAYFSYEGMRVGVPDEVVLEVRSMSAAETGKSLASQPPTVRLAIARDVCRGLLASPATKDCADLKYQASMKKMRTVNFRGVELEHGVLGVDETFCEKVKEVMTSANGLEEPFRCEWDEKKKNWARYAATHEDVLAQESGMGSDDEDVPEDVLAAMEEMRDSSEHGKFADKKSESDSKVDEQKKKNAKPKKLDKPCAVGSYGILRRSVNVCEELFPVDPSGAGRQLSVLDSGIGDAAQERTRHVFVHTIRVSDVGVLGNPTWRARVNSVVRPGNAIVRHVL